MNVSADALRGCHDYLVESPDGQIGTVADVRYGADPQVPTALAIRAGRASTRLLIIPVSQMTSILPTRQRITLRGSPEITASERL